MSRIAFVFMLLALVLSSVDSRYSGSRLLLTDSGSDSNGDGNSDSSDEVTYDSATKHTCAGSGYTLTRTGLIKCTDPDSCDGCDTITCSGCEKVTCNGARSCQDVGGIVVNVGFDGKFALECNGANSCQDVDDTGIVINSGGYDIEYVKCNANRACKGSTIKINCGGKILKGVGCNGYKACYQTEFKINNCITEKIECDGDKACVNAKFTINGGALQQFSCEPDEGTNAACVGVSVTCTGSSVCP